MTNQIDEWVVVLTMLREKSGLYRDEKLCHIIEFLQQAKTNEMLSVTAQIALTKDGPRILDLVQRDFELLSARTGSLECSNIVQIQDIDEIRRELAAVKEETRHLSRRINELEQK